MATVRQLIQGAVEKMFFHELSVEGVREVSPHFKRFDFAGEALRGGRCAAGDKVQFFLEGVTRTYSPFGFDAARGTMSCLAYLHGDTPSSRWGRNLRQGDRASIFGPRGSLALASLQGPVLLFGDETSFGVARALQETRGSADGLSFVFETALREESSAALRALELPTDTLVERRADDGHFTEIEARVRAALEQRPGTRLVLTGKAQSIQALRKLLKARPIAHAGQSVKAYWAPGKRGLD